MSGVIGQKPLTPPILDYRDVQIVRLKDQIEQLQRELQDKRAIIGSQLTFINELRATADRDEQEQKL